MANLGFLVALPEMVLLAGACLLMLVDLRVKSADRAGSFWFAQAVLLACALSTLLVLLGSLCFITIGLLVGSIAKTEDAAAAMANLVTLPMTFLAGVFFPLDSAPGVVRGVSKVLPLTYLADGLRGVAVQDHSFVWTVPKLGLLVAFTVAIAAVALRSFRWSAQ